jgi:acyl phosphate:glycerol-3-phosphate acyltransferase
MNEWWLFLVLPVGAYLVGSIPFCFLAGKASGVDLRTEGTGNPGAGNLRRVVGFPAAMTAGLLDAFKGLFIVLALLGKVPDAVLVVTALATVVGHNWSIFLGFRSGRGLATAAGVVLAISPLLLLWPAGWAIAGWWIGGGVAGFIGWTALPFVAALVDVPQVAVPVTAGLAVLILIRRIQGNSDAEPGWHAAARRMVFDTDRAVSKLDS